jgi:hypothetical protein
VCGADTVLGRHCVGQTVGGQAVCRPSGRATSLTVASRHRGPHSEVATMRHNVGGRGISPLMSADFRNEGHPHWCPSFLKSRSGSPEAEVPKRKSRSGSPEAEVPKRKSRSGSPEAEVPKRESLAVTVPRGDRSGGLHNSSAREHSEGAQQVCTARQRRNKRFRLDRS